MVRTANPSVHKTRLHLLHVLHATALLVATLIATFATYATARAASLQGHWSGSGYVEPASGERERVRCRVTYGRTTRRVFRVVANCATSSLKIRQTGEILMVSPSRFVGDLYNAEYNIAGRVRVILEGSRRQTVTFSGGGGRGRLYLRRR